VNGESPYLFSANHVSPRPSHFVLHSFYPKQSLTGSHKYLLMKDCKDHIFFHIEVLTFVSCYSYTL